MSQDQDQKPAAPAKRDGVEPKGLGAQRNGAPPSPTAPTAPELEEVSGALLIDDDWGAAPDEPPKPAREVSKPPPPPLSRRTAQGTLRPAAHLNASPPMAAPPAPPDLSLPLGHVPSDGASQPALSVPTATGAHRFLGEVSPETRPFPFAVPGAAESFSTSIPAEPPTERSLPMERESALRLPRAWGGVAASAVRDAVHKAGDSLRPTAHALRDAVPKIRDSLHPAANAIRGAVPKIIRDSLRAPSDGGSAMPPRALLAAFATGGLLVGIGLAVPVGLLMRHGPSHPPAEGAGPAGSVASTAPTTAALTKPHESAAALPTCKVAGPPRTLAADATVAAGVEVRTFGSDIALGYAASDTEAKVIRVDPSSLSIVATTTGTSKIAIKRVTPVPVAGGGLGIAIDVDRRNDVVRGRRTISVEPLQQVGVSAGNLVWVQRFGGPGTGKLWPVEKPGEVDSIRSAAGEAGGQKLLALAFRRKSSVAVGLMRAGDTPSPQGELSYFNGLGSSVGSPVVALNGGVVFAAWADRTGPEAAWGIRSVRFDVGGSPAEPRMFTPPPGGKGGPAIAPSIASLPQKGFLLVWSEGPAAGRGVRGMTMAESGESVGKALDLSSAGANAGQAQAAVDPSGHGVVAFLQSAGGNFELVATPIACGP